MRLDEIALQPVFDKKAILAELAKLKIESTSKINADGTVDVSGNVKIPREYTQIPIQFRNVSDDFCCSGSPITTLQHAPLYVGGGFYCSETKITSLQYAPQQVRGDFYCETTQITSLQYAPQSVSGSFACAITKITSLQYAPQQVGDDFSCSGTKITSLQYAPQYVGGDFLCNKTQITSLHNIHKTHSNWVIDGKLLLPETCTHLLGLAYIPGVKRVQLGPDENVIDIIHDVFEWQEKLLEMGLTEQAQL